jgi:hypothetical protein
MKRSPRPRKTANLSDSLRQHLNMYAVAASAAGVSMLASVQSSEARIVYTHVHKVIGPNSQLGLDLNHDGIIDFSIHNAYQFHSKSYHSAALWTTTPPTNALEGLYSFPFSAYALPRGAKVGPPKNFKCTHACLEGRPMLSLSVGRGGIGQWESATNQYLGVQFIDRAGRTHYGWARLTVRGNPNSKIFATLTGYAYETVPNKPIIAGRTKGTDDPTEDPVFANPGDPGPGASLTNSITDTPQVASLGVLALGAQGVPLWRRRQNQPVVPGN